MTLIELIMFIVIVSVGLAGVLASLNVSVKGSADPLRPKQALAIAEGLMEEILLKGYCDPDTIITTRSPPECGTNTSEARTDFDDVQDFDPTSAPTGTRIDTDAVDNPWPSGYTASVKVASGVALGSLANALRVTVSVDYGNGAITLTGYRANY